MKKLVANFDSEKALSEACMPFIKGGGIFITTPESLTLEERVTVSILLFNDANAISFEGKVVWITPSHRHSHLLQGVGIQFPPEEAEEIRRRIEKHAPNAFIGNGMLS